MQACLAIFTVAGMLLMARADGEIRKELRAWIVILMGQVFWLASTLLASQWGMFLVSVIYTFIAIDAITRRWRRVRTWDRIVRGG